MHHPKLRGLPVAVGGDVEARHGIVLAKSYEAKRYGVKTGNAIWEARRLCPDLVVLPPNYPLYLRFSRLFRELLGEYSPQVEPFGLDESWICASHYTNGEAVAREIQRRAMYELGLPVSIGVSWNKIFAKLGSDMHKPMGIAVITPENYKQLVWPLPAGDLLGIGRATTLKLRNYGIHSIGDVANTPPEALHSWLGKWGYILHMFANGRDDSPVAALGEEAAVKSIGNSTTTPRDLENEQDCRIVFYNLAESVAERLRDLGLKGRTVQISLRDNTLVSFERQCTLPAPTNLARELADAAMRLLRENYKWGKPLRSIGVRATQLVPEQADMQLSFFEDARARERWETLERTMDYIRGRFGHHSIDVALMGLDEKLGTADYKSEHVIHPVGFF